MQIGHARKNSRGGLVGYYRKPPRWTSGVEVFCLCRLPFLAANPNLLEEMVEANFVVRGNGCTTVRRVSERTSQRMARTMLRRVKVQVAVSQLDAAVSL